MVHDAVNERGGDGVVSVVKKYSADEEFLIYEGLAQLELAKMGLGFTGKDEGLFGLKAAENCFRKVLKINPKNVEALNLLGQLASGRNEASEAKKFFDEAIKASDGEERPALMETVTGFLADSGKYEQAVEYCLKALKHGETAGMHGRLGYCFGKLRNHEKALEHQRKALELDPTPENHNDLGYTLLLNRQPEKAKQMFEKAVRLNPEYGLAKGNLKLADDLLDDEEEYAEFLADPDAYNEMLDEDEENDDWLEDEEEAKT